MGYLAAHLRIINNNRVEKRNRELGEIDLRRREVEALERIATNKETNK